jgi:adenosylcobyric acid synthase
MAKSIMIQGTGSNVGKSLLVAGICRALSNRGFKVSPFKPQNMSNNAAVTKDNGEIGRAQALQAIASRIKPHSDLNPVLLKPESEIGSQVIVNGKRIATVKARGYAKLKPKLLNAVMKSFGRLKEDNDFVIIEGAGSPAEINLRKGDIANMGFAEVANVPVVLVGDIDRGGVIAQLVGTKTILDPADSERIKGFIINKFRGDISLFDDGLVITKEKTNWSSLGVVPWFDKANILPAEDILDISSSEGGPINIVVPKLRRIANFDDLDPLKIEPSISLKIIERGNPLPQDSQLILIPGSKSTISDLEDFYSQGWDIDLKAHVRRGGKVLGICGGYQMLGKMIHDPKGIEGPPQSIKGLGLLNIETTMSEQKILKEVTATTTDGKLKVNGYEIHIGQSIGADLENSWLKVNNKSVSASSKDGKVQGCYIHGLFSNDAFRSDYIKSLGALASDINFNGTIDHTLNLLSSHIENFIDFDRLISLAE